MTDKNDKIRTLPLKDVVIGGSFWQRYISLVRDKVLPYQWEVMNDNIPDAARSHCIKNFEIAAGKRQGEFYGMVFQDSDLYKWLEAVSYALAAKPDPALEALTDGAIALIGAAQLSDGYVNTYYTVKEPSSRWLNLREGHELYCAGHMIEAAVAYFNATGKREFLNIAIRFADHIDNTFGLEEGKKKGYPGHQEIELALCKLYKVTNEKRYIDLAAYFISQRGNEPFYFGEEQKDPAYKIVFSQLTSLDRTYYQAHTSPSEQRIAVGHAVRAVYMYSAMADLAEQLGGGTLKGASLKGASLKGASLKESCAALFDDISEKQMYITGAIGSVSIGESFTSQYDLPNDLVYGETCASVGLMMFSRRMFAMHRDARYAEIMEKALYNTVLAGISLTGTEFFYVNPLETDPVKIKHNPQYEHIKTVRQKWFDCACCPSNIARTVMGLGLYAYAASQDGLYINLICEGSAKDGERSVEIATAYPFGDTAQIKVNGGTFRLFLRNPENARIKSLKINGAAVSAPTEKGYIVIDREWQGDTVAVEFDLSPKYVFCSEQVQKNTGKAAVMRGPIVYCAEEADNGPLLGGCVLDTDAPLLSAPPPNGLLSETTALKTRAYRLKQNGAGLYTSQKPTLTSCELTLIPYFQWANRGENEMRVFLQALSTPDLS